MELTKLYVMKVNGEAHYFASEYDRNYFFNQNYALANHLPEIEEYEIDLAKGEN